MDEGLCKLAMIPADHVRNLPDQLGRCSKFMSIQTPSPAKILRSRWRFLVNILGATSRLNARTWE